MYFGYLICRPYASIFSSLKYSNLLATVLICPKGISRFKSKEDSFKFSIRLKNFNSKPRKKGILIRVIIRAQVRSFSSLIVWCHWHQWEWRQYWKCTVIVQGQRFNGTCMRGQKCIVLKAGT